MPAPTDRTDASGRPLTASALSAAHREGGRTIADTIGDTYAAIARHGDPALFIALKPQAAALAEAAALQGAGPQGRPLWGVPVAVKDNIDVAGLPTTAGCPAYAYQPQRHASAVQRLVAAGAIIIGKTNLDQFATGLVGVRSPYGVPRNVLRADLVPGGSSSGSASAVAAGLVPLALGTDTAGSGRVPAGLQNIVGLKPSLGLVSTAGVVPACRTLDCVSVFAGTVDDAFLALEAMAGEDGGDAYSRPLPLGAPGGLPPGIRVAVPARSDLYFGGDAAAEASFAAAVARLGALGAVVTEIDLSPFLEAARLLYEGPWVAERWLVIRDLLASDPEAIHPVTRHVIAGQPMQSAADAFAARYRLAALAAEGRRALAGAAALMVPTFPRPVSLEEIAADPYAPNAMLGRYTNFVNLMDLCALAVPASLGADGTAHGVTFIAPAGQDAALAGLGRAFQAAGGLPVGATGRLPPVPAPLPPAAPAGMLALAVVGAHLSGMPLNGELRALGAVFLRAARTAPDYRLFALPGGPPARPGLLRVGAGQGGEIELEVWALPEAAFARFVAAIPAPLGIGTLALADGGAVKGFLVEAQATQGARDVTAFGGWRAYTAST
ncbi:MAG: allophanate hydrolase [Thalassobaculales bacterium]